jgi:ATP-dependent Lhr-like helicase
LLVPSSKRPTLGRNEGKRRLGRRSLGVGGRRSNLASIEFAGRWSLIRKDAHEESNGEYNAQRDAAMEKFARVLLRRYGVMFRRLLERESLDGTWYELGRIYRRLEGRGEIRGGYFIAGVSGEQFALPEAIGLLRSIRKASPDYQLITLSAADPLNLQGILTPGSKVAAFTTNRLLFCNGLPVGALEGGEIHRLSENSVSDSEMEAALRVGKLRPSLRPYYK